MLRLLLPVFLLLTGALPAYSQEDEKKALEGTWEAKSMIADGMPAPQEAIELLRFRFAGDKLFIRGNTPAKEEDECTFVLDDSEMPAHFTFQMVKEKSPILGIYELKGKDELLICVRHDGSDKGRPKKFESPKGSDLVLVEFRRKP